MKALVIDDEPPIRELVADVLLDDGWSVDEAESGEHAFEMLGRENWQLVFCDVQLGGADGFDVLRRFTEEHPESHVILMTGFGSAAGALEAVSLGAYDYLLKPFNVEEIQHISRSVRDKLKRRSPRVKETEEHPVDQAAGLEMVGRSPAFVEVMKLVGRVAGTNLPVLITGESGTGKELVARAIHLRSLRASGPFIAVNCGALPAELIESELFGHIRGSFTGATVDRRGLWEEADCGTVFLDEITETTLLFQVKLLRALQSGEIRRVGSNKTINVDVRVIAATNRDAEREVRESHFRQDLLYRLNAVTIHLPPLRERREDILPLAQHFARRVVRPGEPPVTFSPEVLRLFDGYPWPGNIRELENAVMRAAALCDHIVMPENLPERIRYFAELHEMAPQRITASPGCKEHWPTITDLVNNYVLKVLAHTGGNKQAASRILGVDRTTIQRIIKRHKLDVGDLKNED
jgi:DNA-binding NtrC family response regulator